MSPSARLLERAIQSDLVPLRHFYDPMVGGGAVYDAVPFLYHRFNLRSQDDLLVEHSPSRRHPWDSPTATIEPNRGGGAFFQGFYTRLRRQGPPEPGAVRLTIP